MNLEIIILIAASVVALLLILGVRTWRLKRMMHANEISWRGAIGVSILIGALAAGTYSIVGKPSRDVPPDVVDKAIVPEKG